LFKNIQAAKHFILVLTPHSLDRLLGDNNCEDWVRKELRCAFEYHKNVIPIFDQHFEFPAVESELPDDIRQITKFNGVRWVHDYQEACIDKVERFIKGELNRTPSIGPNQVRFIYIFITFLNPLLFSWQLDQRVLLVQLERTTTN
jgi:hypothetical protein